MVATSACTYSRRTAYLGSTPNAASCSNAQALECLGMTDGIRWKSNNRHARDAQTRRAHSRVVAPKIAARTCRHRLHNIKMMLLHKLGFSHEHNFVYPTQTGHRSGRGGMAGSKAQCQHGARGHAALSPRPFPSRGIRARVSTRTRPRDAERAVGKLLRLHPSPPFAGTTCTEWLHTTHTATIELCPRPACIARDSQALRGCGRQAALSTLPGGRDLQKTKRRAG